MKYFFLFIAFYISQPLFAQKSFDAKKNEVLRYIERNFELENSNVPNKNPELFVYTISIDAEGNIQNVYTLILDSLSYSKQVFQMADSIKSKFSFVKSGIPEFSQLIIPVLIIHSKEDDTISNYEQTILNITDFFGQLSKYKLKKVLVSRIAIVNQFALAKEIHDD